MALPGFRPSVQLSEDPPRLTDKTSGRTLTISRGEAKLLSLYDGVKTHDQLAAAAQSAGFHVEPSHVAGLLERVAHAGFMTELPPSSLSSSSDLEHPSDAVPTLRSDLKIVVSEKTKGLFEVTDTVRGQTFSLYDFEVSIARMLNGRRSAAQVIDGAAKIGIPVTLESLRKFLKQLRAYNFLLETRSDPKPLVGGTWSPRSQWKPEVRELFQSALRKFRAGKAEEAIDYLVALLQIDPDNGEARELQQRINSKLDEPTESQDFTFDELHGGADAAPDWSDAPASDAAAVTPSAAGAQRPLSQPPVGAAPERLPPSVTGARAPLSPAPVGAAPEHVPPSGTGPQPTHGSAPSVTGPQRTFSPAAGSPTAWPVRGPSLENPVPPPEQQVPPNDGGPELGEPLHFARKNTGEVQTGFQPELIDLRTTTGEQRAATGFDPPQLETGTAVDEGQAAAAQAEGVWSPPPRRTSPPRPSTEERDEAPPKKRRGKGGLIFALVALIALAGAAAFPVPMQGKADCTLSPVEAAQVTAAADGKIKELLVKDGDTVEQGKPVATLDASELEAKVQAAEARITSAQTALAALDKKVNPRALKKAEAAVAKAKKPLLKLEASDKRLMDQKARFEGPDVKPSMKRKPLAAIAKKLKENEKARAKAQKKLLVAEKALKKVTLDARRAPLLADIENAKAEKEAAAKEIEARAIVASASGTWKAADMAPDAELKAGDVVGSIVTTSKLELTSEVKAPSATLVVGAARSNVSLNNGSATIDNADAKLKPGACTLEYDGGKQPLYKRYVKL